MSHSLSLLLFSPHDPLSTNYVLLFLCLYQCPVYKLTKCFNNHHCSCILIAQKFLLQPYSRLILHLQLLVPWILIPLVLYIKVNIQLLLIPILILSPMVSLLISFVSLLFPYPSFLYISRTKKQCCNLPGSKQAMNEEKQALVSRVTRDLVSAQNTPIVGCRWIYLSNPIRRVQ